MTPTPARRSRPSRVEDALKPRGEKGKRQAGEGFGRVRRESEFERLGLPKVDVELSPERQAELDSRLLTAVGQTYHKTVHRLIHAGANVNTRHGGYRRYTALHWAASQNDTAMTRALLESGADVHAADNYHTTPLHWAAEKGSTQTVKQLLAHGADVNAVTRNGATALYLAATSSRLDEPEGRVTLLRFLLAHGANPTLANRNGKTPAQSATSKAARELLTQALQEWKATHA